MKIQAEPPRPMPEWPAPQSGEPAQPFPDLLADLSQRAARFTELGIFGMSRAVTTPPPAGGDAKAAPGQPAPPDPPTVPALRAGGTAPVTVSETPPAAAASLDTGKPVTCELPRPVPAKTATPDVCTLPGDSPDRARELDAPVGPEPGTRTSRTRPRPPTPRPGVSLTLRETDGAVEIVAGAPPIDAETRAQLRRLIEAILTRNGLSLAQFQLNGAPLAPDLSGRRGGTYGTRTR